MSDEEVGLAVEDGIKAAVAGKPSELTPDHPPAFTKPAVCDYMTLKVSIQITPASAAAVQDLVCGRSDEY